MFWSLLFKYVSISESNAIISLGDVAVDSLNANYVLQSNEKPTPWARPADLLHVFKVEIIKRQRARGTKIFSPLALASRGSDADFL